MSPEELRARLEASRPFQDLAGQAALDELAARCEGIGAPAGDVIVAEDSEGDAMYVIGGGRVRVEKRTLYGDEYTVRFLEAGDFFGEVALLTRERILPPQEEGARRDVYGFVHSSCRALVYEGMIAEERQGLRSSGAISMAGLV